MTTEPAPRHAEPKQERSRQTRERICAAMLELLEEKPYHAIAMEELAERADCAISSLYSRFSSKLALLHFLHQRAVDDAEAALAPLAQLDPHADGSLAELAEGITRHYVAYRRRHWALLRATRQLEASDSKIRTRREQHDQRAFSEIRRAFLARAKALGASVREEQAERVILMAAGAIRAIVDDPGHGANSSEGWKDEAQAQREIEGFIRTAVEGLLRTDPQD